MARTWKDAQAERENVYADAYGEGYRNGQLDRGMGCRSEYSFNSGGDGSYAGAYGTGYRDGVLGLRSRNPWSRLTCAAGVR